MMLFFLRENTGLPAEDETSGTTVCFLTFMIPCNCKIVPFFAISFSNPTKNIFKAEEFILPLVSNFKSYRSSIQPHP